jgi:hypothetical protein
MMYPFFLERWNSYFLFDTVRIWDISLVWADFDKCHNLSKWNVKLIYQDLFLTKIDIRIDLRKVVVSYHIVLLVKLIFILHFTFKLNHLEHWSAEVNYVHPKKKLQMIHHGHHVYFMISFPLGSPEMSDNYW